MPVPVLTPTRLLALTLLVGTPAVAQSASRDARPGASESRRQPTREADASAGRGEVELERLREGQPGPGGLVGLREAGLLDEAGVSVHVLYPDLHFTQWPEETRRVKQVTVYRASRRMALELKVVNRGAEPMKVTRAELVGPGGERLKLLRVWPPESILPGTRWKRLLVEAEWEGALAPGPYRLELWNADGQREATLEGVTFP